MNKMIALKSLGRLLKKSSCERKEEGKLFFCGHGRISGRDMRLELFVEK